MLSITQTGVHQTIDHLDYCHWNNLDGWFYPNGASGVEPPWKICASQIGSSPISRGQNINFFFLDLPSPRWQDSNCLTPSPATTSHVRIFLSRVAMPKLSVMYSDLLMKGMDFLEASLAWFGCFQVAHGTTEFPSATKNLWKALPSMKLRGCGFFTGALYWVFHHKKKKQCWTPAY